MSGFSLSWLALREPADHAARDPGLVADLARSLAGARDLTILDLGCGTGSNLRGLAPHLGPGQTWRLVDHDPTLLDAARVSLVAWADAVETAGEDLVLTKHGSRIVVSFAVHDLSAGLSEVLLHPPTLVTAAALFDLASRAWTEDLVGRLAAAGAVFYTSLSYDGTETWTPPHPADDPVHEAFLLHQAGDKGFGPALGREATTALAGAFRRRGYAVSTGASPWRLGPDEADLVAELRAGKAAAAAETGLVAAELVRRWADGPVVRATIGHADLLALPPG